MRFRKAEQTMKITQHQVANRERERERERDEIWHEAYWPKQTAWQMHDESGKRIVDLQKGGQDASMQGSSKQVA